MSKGLHMVACAHGSNILEPARIVNHCVNLRKKFQTTLIKQLNMLWTTFTTMRRWWHL